MSHIELQAMALAFTELVIECVGCLFFGLGLIVVAIAASEKKVFKAGVIGGGVIAVAGAVAAVWAVVQPIPTP